MNAYRLIANNHLVIYTVMRREGQHNLLAEYLNNFSRENQIRDNNENKNKLILADLQAIERESPRLSSLRIVSQTTINF